MFKVSPGGFCLVEGEIGGAAAVVRLGVGWVEGDGGCGVDDCEAVVFDFDVGLGAVGEDDGVCFSICSITSSRRLRSRI